MNLDHIAAKLEGLEETIIHKLIDRAQYKANSVIYMPGKSGFKGEPAKSLLEIRLMMQEDMDAQFGRYLQPEERPFTQRDLRSKREVSIDDSYLAIDDYDKINLTEKILSSYIDLIPSIYLPGDDQQYGSSVVADVYALQAIAERIHYGSLYVAECKFKNNSDQYLSYIQAKNKTGLLNLLTRKEVEEKILSRVKEKVEYIQAKVNTNVRNKINPSVVLQYYKNHIIPLTKEGEILYLFNRKI